MKKAQQTDSQQFIKYWVDTGYACEQQEKYSEACQYYESALNRIQDENEPLRQVQTFLQRYGEIGSHGYWGQFCNHGYWGQLLAFALKYKKSQAPNARQLFQAKSLELIGEFCQKYAKEESVTWFEQLLKNEDAYKFSWLYTHHATCGFQHYILPQEAGAVLSKEELHEKEVKLIIATLCDPDNLRAFAALGELYRYMSIRVKLFFHEAEFERKIFYTQSLICFEIAIQKFGTPEITKRDKLKNFSFLPQISSGNFQEVTNSHQASPIPKQQEAWVYAHAGAAICNARLHTEYETAMELLNHSILCYSQSSLPREKYYWALEYLATAKLLVGISGSFDDLSAIKNFISSIDNFINSIPWLPGPLLRRIPPQGEPFENMHVAMIYLLWNKVMANDPHALEVGEALCSQFLGTYLSQQEGAPFRYPDLQTLLDLARVTCIAAIIAQKSSTQTTLITWSADAKSFLAEVLAIFLKLVVATGPKDEAYSVYLGEMYSHWKVEFANQFKSEEEQILVIAEISQYLLAVHQLPGEVDTPALHYKNQDTFLETIYDVFNQSNVTLEVPFKEVLKTGEPRKLIEKVFNRYYQLSIIEEDINNSCEEWCHFSKLIKAVLGDESTWAGKYCDLYTLEADQNKKDFSRRMAFFGTSSIGHINF